MLEQPCVIPMWSEFLEFYTGGSEFLEFYTGAGTGAGTLKT